MAASGRTVQPAIRKSPGSMRQTELANPNSARLPAAAISRLIFASGHRTGLTRK
jgi:hypothetical protein